MGDDKDKAPPPVITPLPPPRAEPKLTPKQREQRSASADANRKLYGDMSPLGIPSRVQETTVSGTLLFPKVEVVTLDFDYAHHVYDGITKFDPGQLVVMPSGTQFSLKERLFPTVDKPTRIPIYFHDAMGVDYAKGDLLIARDATDNYTTNGRQLLFFNHTSLPWLGGDKAPMFEVQIDKSMISGRIVLAQNPTARTWDQIDSTSAVELLGLEDLHDLKAGAITNERAAGHLRFELSDLGYKFQGLFPGLGKFSLEDSFKGDAEVEAKGVDKKSITISRDEDGALSAQADLAGSLTARGETIKTELKASFSRGTFDIDGTATYTFSSKNPAVSGSVKVRLTDLATARNAIRRRLGRFAPNDPVDDTAPNGLALWGEGDVDFKVNDWLKGRATVVADPDGFVTVIGELRPAKRIQVFEQFPPPLKDYFSAAGQIVNFASFVAGKKLGFGGSINLKPSGSIGPGTIEDIQLDGVFTTYPKERLASQFAIQGTFVVPAKLGLDVIVEVGLSAAGVVGAGLRVTGGAKLSARGSVTPRIGLEPPPGKTEPEFFIAGTLNARATLDLVVDVECVAYVDTPFWKDEVAFKLIPQQRFRLGDTGLSVSGKYYFGQGSTPKKVNYDINARQPTSPNKHEGFNNDRFANNAYHRRFEGTHQTDSRSLWFPERYRAAKAVDDITPAEGQPESEVSTQALAAGGLDPYESADETPTTVPPPPATPPTAIAGAPTASIGGGSSTPPPPPTTPPSTTTTTPPDPTTAPPTTTQPDPTTTPPTTTPPDPTTTPPTTPPDPTTTTPPTTTPPTTPPTTTPPTTTPPTTPPPGGTPPTAAPTPPQPLRKQITMLDQEHVLWLYRPHPAYIDMTHLDGGLRERLRFKLRVTEIVLRNQLDLAQTQNTVRSADELQRELNEIDRLTAQCDAVEAILHDLEDPLHLPTHVADFDTLADDLEAYARLFQRSDLFDESFLRGVPSPAPPQLPPQYHSNQLLRQLERAEPGRVQQLITAHGHYVANFNASTRKKPTATPMTELAYLEMRARFRLGNLAEEPTVDVYSRVTGRTIKKNNFTIEILDLNGKKERGRKPDFFELGKLIGDFKNVSEQDFSEQMRDNFRIAKANDVRVSPGISGTGKWRVLDPNVATDLTPRFDLVVRVPWHPRGETKVDDQLENAIKAHGTGGEVLELIDDPIHDD